MFGRVNTLLLSLLVFTAPAIAWAAEAAPATEEGGGSMPQLDPTFYPSQIFWLIITCALMFALMSKVALPRVARMVQFRDDQVRRDLEKAYRLRREAEDMQIIYTRSLRDADEKAKTMLDKIVNEARAKHAKAMEETQDRITQTIAETEQFLRGEKEVLLKEATHMADRLSKTIVSTLSAKA
jgi:F-type H+-transporting ATPase subunit b